MYAALSPNCAPNRGQFTLPGYQVVRWGKLEGLGRRKDLPLRPSNPLKAHPFFVRIGSAYFALEWASILVTTCLASNVTLTW